MSNIPVWAYITTCLIGTILIGVAYAMGRASTFGALSEENDAMCEHLKENKVWRKDMRNRFAQMMFQKGSAIREAQFWKRTAKNLGWHKGMARPTLSAVGSDPVPTETVSR